MTRVQQMLLHRRKTKKLRESKKRRLGDAIGHNAFQVYNGNFKARAHSRSPLQHWRKSIFKQNYDGSYITIIRFKNRISCLLRRSIFCRAPLILVSELTISGSGNKLVYFNTLIFSCKWHLPAHKAFIRMPSVKVSLLNSKVQEAP